MTKSLKNPARPSRNIARTGSAIWTNAKIDADAPTKPMIATIRRASMTLPMARARRGMMWR